MSPRFFCVSFVGMADVCRTILLIGFTFIVPIAEELSVSVTSLLSLELADSKRPLEVELPT